MVQRTVLLKRVSGALALINGISKFIPQPDAADKPLTDTLLGRGELPGTSRRPPRGALLLTLAVLAGLLLYRRPWARSGASLEALLTDSED
ncbi:MAG TPA: hypothetical protein VFA06_18730 [Actinocrinis sp.]|uniref:hypothetical protein n=1 Tax=Actinocrinis sp. TaxID=1920516 RepID=UPI002D4C7909|nr:hypothetical protein [Actinocrinis sp.]HZU57916.1 hypothetical protein [Actinocrinis sp.]